MNNKSVFNKGIDKIYNKIGYFDKYGGSFIITLITLLSFLLVFCYFWVVSRIGPIKADWNNQKCHPAIVPFAGMINAPPGESKFKFTADNFTGCLYNILSTIIGRFTKPVFFLSDTLTRFFKMLIDMVNAVRSIIDYVRSKIMAMIMEILDRFVNVVTPIQIMVVKLKSLLGKVQGVMISALYTAIGSYFALKSFIGAFLKLLILALIVLAGVVIILWIFPFTWALAATGTAAYVAVAIPTIIISIWMGHILNVHPVDVIPGLQKIQ